MPLATEAESQDLVQRALDTLRRKMEGGVYPQDESYDVLDRILAAGAAGDTGYKEALDTAQEEAPNLLRAVLGSQAPILDRLNLERGGAYNASDWSAPVYSGGQIGQINLKTHEFRPATTAATMPNELPPGYSPSRFMTRPFMSSRDPGFFYAGSAEPEQQIVDNAPYDTRGESAARAAYEQTPQAEGAFQEMWKSLHPELQLPTTEAFDPTTAKALPIQGLQGSFYVPTPKGIVIHNAPAGGGGLTVPQKNTIRNQYITYQEKLATGDPRLEPILTEEINRMQTEYPWLKGTNAPAGLPSLVAAQVEAMPSKKSDLQKGHRYQTSRGIATWDGEKFVQ